MNEEKRAPYSLDNLGFADETVTQIRQATENPDGAVIISGMTASGKTTTSLALLGEMSPKVNKILALEAVSQENPLFRSISNVTLLPISLGLSVAHYNSFTAPEDIEPDYDYDAVFFNELRDPETFARLAYARSRKPGYPITTMHAKSAAQTLTRLGEISNGAFGVIEFAISTVICQSLVKVLCSCREEYFVDHAENPEFAGRRLFRAKGCAKCYYKGYRGRRPLAEVMNVSIDMISAMINNFGNVEFQIEEMAKKDGMKTIADQAEELLYEGVIDLEQFYYKFCI